MLYDSDSPAYLHGCRFALLCALQELAQGKVGTPLDSKYMKGMLYSPKRTMVIFEKRGLTESPSIGEMKMSKETMHDFYVATARKRGNGWKATKLDKIYVFLSSKLSPLQDTFGTDQQQEFLFGFDHMRGWIRMKKEDRIEWEKKNGAAPAAFLWNKDE